MKIGKVNTLKVDRSTNQGFYLTDSEKMEVFLPIELKNEPIKVGEEVKAFIFNDIDGKQVATTFSPYIQLDQFAFLKVSKIQAGIVFMDWGLPEGLQVPFEEQDQKMHVENWYLIFLTKDEENGELIGSNKVNDFVFFDEIDLKIGDEVDLLLYNLSDLGMNAIVNNLFKGLIFNSDIHKSIHPGDQIKGYVKLIREDGKIDLVLEPLGYKKSIDHNSKIILDALQSNDGFIELTDKSSPEEIKFQLGLSKKAFKKGLGSLYKQRLVEIYKDGIKLL